MPTRIPGAISTVLRQPLHALALLGALLATTPSSAREGALATPATPVAPVVPAVSILPPGVSPLPAYLSLRLAELLRQTEERRGLLALHPVAAGVVDERRLHRQVRSDLRHQLPPGRLVPLTAALEAFGLIPRGTDLSRAYLDVLDRQIGGYYDPERSYLALVRRGGTLPGQERLGEEKKPGQGGELASRGEEMVLVHELTHALQDQHFPLDAFTDVDPLLDASAARTAVVEGDATLTMLDWLSGPSSVAPGADRILDVEALTAGAADMPGLDHAPPWLRDSLLFGYVEGYLFCASARAHGGRGLIDHAFTDDPPRSSEQILHPEKWHTHRDDPVAIAWPDLTAVLPGARWIAAGEMGELGIRSLLRPIVERAVASQAAAGWGGDRFVLYERGRGRRILVWITDWDSQADAAEFAAATLHLANGLEAGRGGPRRVWVVGGELAPAEREALAALLTSPILGEADETARGD